MPVSFHHVQFHVAEKSEDELRTAGVRRNRPLGLGVRTAAVENNVRFNNDETAARFFLGKVLGVDERPTLRGITAPDRPEVVPDLQMQRVQDSPLTNTRLVSFDQTKTSIPIFGTRAVVELDQDRNLVGLSADFAEVPDIPPVAQVSPADALYSIAKWTGTELRLDSVNAPKLSFFQRQEENDDSWHLVYVFERLFAVPPDLREGHRHGHGLGRSPREMKPQFTYLVDAHSGEIVFHFSNTPLVVASPLPLPAQCRGIDEEGVVQEFFGHRRAAGGFELFDPFRSIRTFDLAAGDIDGHVFPTDAVFHTDFDFVGTNRGAVSAHLNAMRVHDFYKGVLMRDGIDDKGMDLVSVVNCTYAADQAPPEWHNAVWWNGRMWYGQRDDGTGRLISFSRFLDVIAHELTHGVTDHSSNLVYKNQSGALNESFSDIFGIIIKNWTEVGPDTDPGTWDWELGSGLGSHGRPLRDLSNPARTGDPDHMDNFLVTTADQGGVHTNSNIHNKAAFNVLMATDAQGERVFPSREAAILYYLTLIRLSSLATFRMALVTLLDVAKTLYPDPAERNLKLQAIRNAYGAVGIRE